MLIGIEALGRAYIDAPPEAWAFDEVELSQDMREALTELDIEIVLYRYSAKITTRNGHCYIPLQYLLYAVKIRPMVELLFQYFPVFEDLKNEKSASEFADVLMRYKSDPVTDKLDLLSKDRFYELFNETNARLHAKNIINADKSARGIADFFGSVILKALPVPDSSSTILATLIYKLACKPTVYDKLEQVYAWAIPEFISASSGDDLLYHLFCMLSARDNLNTILGNTEIDRFFSIPNIEKLFLFSSTAVAGNNSYIDEPVAYLHEEDRYVHLKKDILEQSEGLDSVNKMLEGGYSGIEVRESQTGYSLCATSRVSVDDTATGGHNKIYYGAPGTGKSYQVDKLTKGHEVFRTVFHPDTQYSDFAGGLKPTVGENGVEYAFRPGPFTSAYIGAMKNPRSSVFLIIEELNRAPASAVFGELFQLLDRDHSGRSVYTIDASDPDMAQFIDSNIQVSGAAGKLCLPSNLSILATMNSSDQAVMPMDTAFKRRWLFEYLPIDYSQATPGIFSISISGDRNVEVEWHDFAKIINDTLIELQVPEDRLLGHRFLSEKELKTENAQDALKGKLLVYLWDDVLRHGKREQVFATNTEHSSIGTFGNLSSDFEKQKPVFSEFIEQKLIAANKSAASEAF